MTDTPSTPGAMRQGSSPASPSRPGGPGGTPIPSRRVRRFGFHSPVERLHGRLAMLGFIALVALEWKLGHGLLIWP